MDPVEELKAKGNKMFQAGKFSMAAAAYKEALLLLPGPPFPGDRLAIASVLCSNTSMCLHRMLDPKWDEMEAEAKRAVDYDRFNAKAHYLVGLCLCRRKLWSDGINSLERAKQMAERQKKPAALLAEFDAAIAAGRFEWHSSSLEVESKADDELRKVLIDAIDARRARNVKRLSETEQAPTGEEAQGGGASARPASDPAVGVQISEDCGAKRLRRYSSITAARETGGQPLALDVILSGPPSSTPTLVAMLERAGPASGEGAAKLVGQRRSSLAGSFSLAPKPTESAANHTPLTSVPPRLPETVMRALDDDASHFMACVEQLFSERETARRSRHVPEHFTCGITLDVMLDPVITPAGHSYERTAIETYLHKVKSEDPRTRAPLIVAQLVPNLALKEAITCWLAEHPWGHPRLPVS